jgi:integrase
VKARSARKASVIPDPARPTNAKRDWFLRGSTWDDVVWIFAPTNLLEEERPWRIRWDFTVSGKRRFSDPQYAMLRETTKQLMSLIRTRSLHSGLAQRPSTMVGYFMRLRQLLRWMDAEGFRRFNDLDSAALLGFQHAITQRKGRIGPKISATGVQHHLNVLVYLYHHRDALGDGLSVDPFSGRSPGQAAGVHRSDHHYGLYTPDAIAVPLIQQSIEFLESGTIDILRAREIYATTMADAHRCDRAISNCNLAALRALRHISIETPRGAQKILTIPDLSYLVDRLYAACFIVISYLVGPRASEVLHLHAGCVQSRAMPGSSGETELVVMVGTIFKHEVDYYGRPHEWVVPQAAVHAISVLEALSAPHRLQTGRPELWLRRRSGAHPHGATEWQREPIGPFQIPTSTAIAYVVNLFARWLGLPQFEGRRWHLTTHQGRRTFSRFAALRDRTGLFALAQQLGHRDRSITDAGYVGNDYALNREIHAEVLEQSVSAWEHMLSAPELGGRAGSEILARRPQFRGGRMKKDLKAYARMLVEAGLTLGVCDWGFCLYQQEYSACRGNAAGPNPVNREPSTCARCKNFAVSTQHGPYWLDQVRRSEALLNEPALPTQTLKIVRKRLEEGRATLRSIDSTAKEVGHGHKTPH